MQKTFAMIKPDAVSAGYHHNILQELELAGFAIVSKARVQLTRARAAEFYAEHKGKHFYEKLVDFMSSGPVIALVLAKEEAITGWRTLMGPTNSVVAKEQKPDSLRGKYGTDGTYNACHGADSPASAAREIKFFFPRLILDPLPDPATAKTFIIDHLQPTLVKGLTALCKQKPSADKMEAITWLAHWLLDNNPNKPRTVDHDQLELKPEDEEEGFDLNEGGQVEKSVEEMEQDLAATRVQSHFRGYQARRNIQKKKEGPKVSIQTHEMADDEKSAVKIQALYRGHAGRKRVKGLKSG